MMKRVRDEMEVEKERAVDGEKKERKGKTRLS